MEEKVADSKGRLYLGKWYANKKLYVVDLGGVIVLLILALRKKLGRLKIWKIS
ncbi:hypothetical protein [Acidianus infernus]|uniref:hypothetical protein n=1 Tax=Acidianus infernus TaxID=12915 RepID=UPI00197A994E|nr:hypothetical protein [Acidianus infernus]